MKNKVLYSFIISFFTLSIISITGNIAKGEPGVRKLNLLAQNISSEPSAAPAPSPENPYLSSCPLNMEVMCGYFSCCGTETDGSDTHCIDCSHNKCGCSEEDCDSRMPGEYGICQWANSTSGITCMCVYIPATPPIPTPTPIENPCGWQTFSCGGECAQYPALPQQVCRLLLNTNTFPPTLGCRCASPPPPLF